MLNQEKKNVTGLSIEGALKFLQDNGFRIGLPAHEPYTTWSVDYAVAQQTVCDYCGEDHLSFMPFTNRNGEYRALALCRCGRVTEI